MDMISSLPDPILCYILSFLPLHVSATTSVVAKRWRYLWTYARDLYFDSDKYYDSCSKNKMDFLDMVDGVLLLHNGSIDGLIICSDGETTPTQCQVDAWVSTAIRSNVQVLALSYLSGARLPRFGIKCSTLVDLTLLDCTISFDPGAVCLPGLKKLHLERNWYRDDESLASLVSGCSAIEDLVIHREFFDGMTSCYARSPTLKSLLLLFYVSDHDHEHELVLDIPAIKCLEIYADFSQIIIAEHLSSLAVAEISFSSAFHKEVNIRCWNDLLQFFEKLSNAKTLTFICRDSTKPVNLTSSIVLTRFHNLTEMEWEADWHLLTELLESAYNLESLTVREVGNELRCWREPKHLPKCLLSSLKFVSICGFAGSEPEIDMVRYILWHAKVLERIKINTESWLNSSINVHSKLNMLQRISYFARGSTKCLLTFI